MPQDYSIFKVYSAVRYVGFCSQVVIVSIDPRTGIRNARLESRQCDSETRGKILISQRVARWSYDRWCIQSEAFLSARKMNRSTTPPCSAQKDKKICCFCCRRHDCRDRRRFNRNDNGYYYFRGVDHRALRIDGSCSEFKTPALI